MVVDFGCGTGANCPLFTPPHYLGTDPDQQRIHYAKRKYSKHSFHVLENHQLPVNNSTVDYIIIIAVLHHIASEEIGLYMKEFQRILKPSGTILAIEPCFCEQKSICNEFMKWYDNGEYIRNEEDYLQLFRKHGYDCTVRKRFRKCFLYNELFFSANPKIEVVQTSQENELVRMDIPVFC